MSQYNGGSASSGGDSMRTREWLQRHPAVTAVAAVLILGAAVFYIWRTWNPRPGSPNTTDSSVYFYDLHTKELFPAKATDIPPIDTPSGPKMGVRAHVFGWGNRPKDHLFVAYLQRYTDQAKASMQARMKQDTYDPRLGLPPMSPADVELRAADDDTWVPPTSGQGAALVREPFKRCPPGENPVELEPNSP